jgi:hypothetical protein
MGQGAPFGSRPETGPRPSRTYPKGYDPFLFSRWRVGPTRQDPLQPPAITSFTGNGRREFALQSSSLPAVSMPRPHL